MGRNRATSNSRFTKIEQIGRVTRQKRVTRSFCPLARNRHNSGCSPFVTEMVSFTERAFYRVRRPGLPERGVDGHKMLCHALTSPQHLVGRWLRLG